MTVEVVNAHFVVVTDTRDEGAAKLRVQSAGHWGKDNKPLKVLFTTETQRHGGKHPFFLVRTERTRCAAGIASAKLQIPHFVRDDKGFGEYQGSKAKRLEESAFLCGSVAKRLLRDLGRWHAAAFTQLNYLVEDALGDFPLRSFGNVDHFFLRDDGDGVAVGIEADAFARDVIGDDGVQ